MRALGDYLAVKVHACVGGTSVREDQRILQSGVHVVVGTPGRVYDMLRRHALRPDNIKMFVLDEADEMLSRGFKDQVSAVAYGLIVEERTDAQQFLGTILSFQCVCKCTTSE